MTELTPVLSEEQIHTRIKAVAQKISEDHEGKNLIMIGVLKGAFIFLADLVRQISIPCTIDFIGASSYGKEKMSSGHVLITKDVDLNLDGAHVVLVEDIVDTGLTLSHLIKHLENRGAVSVKICTLLDKHERRENNVPLDYVCHTIQEGFIVGYGIDYAEKYRHLPAIYHIQS
ncbi:hypoxanthine phosphoribosyltransferase [Desulfobotulus alkaliphilus]|uniref:Hypoxanthine phosphoribosyltransferase n=1 Tax=Desulfobotulus alkaliphilus TaxID=622671 RepID=A0A562RTM2_9BACT|nr:hypoxanthine phosphoribosyltransferase [Desulfobotulus alkaliphilus]TWI72475.1 hypoxanthine phosphoribosyltransferase [Desulfobotulus alkaliphilus]